MNIAVVDDEKLIREQIDRLIEKQMPDCSLGYYAAGNERVSTLYFLIYRITFNNGNSSMSYEAVCKLIVAFFICGGYL